ncbi:hypothetical protein PoB_002164700 [Plakobranchus ocellatus]|uniref:Uncharacterized protein n=1 Tax=Plakobranchus ocellatus TaxID=259542 RepID=A0AAV3ZKN6_9GAST|nr:hypothetical protein PoB_002164700 [Plakobranchus ocellatus]
MNNKNKNNNNNNNDDVVDDDNGDFRLDYFYVSDESLFVLQEMCLKKDDTPTITLEWPGCLQYTHGPYKSIRVKDLIPDVSQYIGAIFFPSGHTPKLHKKTCSPMELASLEEEEKITANLEED